MVLNGFAKVLDRFLLALDGEGVGIFQAIVYLHLAAGGAYCALIARGVPDSIQDTMGRNVNGTWLWLCMGVTICLLGKVMSSKPYQRRYWVHTTGLALQLAGDLFAFGAFWGYVLATLQTSVWGTALIAIWIFAALGDCAALLILRDIRRWQQAERAVRA